MATYFTSDTHFGHSNVIRYCNRPFQSAEEMDNTIISNWNNRVKPDDEIYHLGDFSFRDPLLYTSRLNGRKFLIPGNHDRRNLPKLKTFFTVLPALFELKIQDQLLVLCHYNMRVWNKSHYGAWHLFGHSHGSLNHMKDLLGKALDVGVDSHDFTPWSLEEINLAISERKSVAVDHHVSEE